MWFSFERSLVGSSEASHDGPSTFGNHAGSYTTTGDVTVADGSLRELGTAPVTNGDPETGIVTVPGGKLAVFKTADGSLLALNQAVPMDWGA